MYQTIEDIICDDKIIAIMRVKALNRFEEVYNGCFNISSLTNSFGKTNSNEVERAYKLGMIAANSIVSYYK